MLPYDKPTQKMRTAPTAVSTRLDTDKTQQPQES